MWCSTPHQYMVVVEVPSNTPFLTVYLRSQQLFQSLVNSFCYWSIWIQYHLSTPKQHQAPLDWQGHSPKICAPWLALSRSHGHGLHQYWRRKVKSVLDGPCPLGCENGCLVTMVTVGLCRSRSWTWLEVVPVSAATSTATIEKLREQYLRHMDLPERIVTDNGTVFTSEEFENFLHQNGIAHTRTAPYHPTSNGLAEHAVQMFKQGIKRLHEGTVQLRLNCHVSCWSIDSHSIRLSGRSPCRVVVGKTAEITIRFTPSRCVWQSARECQARQQRAHDRHARARAFQVGDRPSVWKKFVRISRMDGRNCFGQDWSSVQMLKLAKDSPHLN